MWVIFRAPFTSRSVSFIGLAFSDSLGFFSGLADPSTGGQRLGEHVSHLEWKRFVFCHLFVCQPLPHRSPFDYHVTELFIAVKYERIKFLVIALKDSVEIYAWAPKPYHKFMAFKSFPDLVHKPLLVDMTIEEGIRLKVIYGSSEGFHAVDLDCGAVYDIYVPTHVSCALIVIKV